MDNACDSGVVWHGAGGALTAGQQYHVSRRLLAGTGFKTGTDFWQEKASRQSREFLLSGKGRLIQKY